MSVIHLNSDKSELQQNVPSETGILSSLSDFAPFQNLTDAVMKVVEEAADFREYKSGETIFSFGQYEGDAWYIVASGCLKATITNPQSGAMFIEQIEVGESFGFDVALGEQGSDVAGNITLQADVDSRLWVVDTAAFLETVSNRPSLAKNLLFYLATTSLKTHFRVFEFNTVPEQRVYELLLSYAERNEVSGEWHIPNMPKHRELAELAEVEEHEAANAIAQLIQDNVARRNYPGLVIEDMSALNRLAQ